MRKPLRTALASAFALTSFTLAHADITIGVQVTDTTVAAARSTAASAQQAVLDSLKTNGVANEDARTVEFQVNPQYGRLDYSRYSIVASTPTVTRSAGPSPTASPSGLAPAC